MNEVTAFMYYMFNKWNEYEANAIFGNDLGNHIWNKYLSCTDKLYFYAELDNVCRHKLVDRAKSFYK